MKKKDCLFCGLDRWYIFENEHFYSVFDVYPVSPGHALVIPKNHIVSLLDLEWKYWEFMWDAIKGTIRIIEDSDLKEVYNEIILNNISDKSVFFCKRMLFHGWLEVKPWGYNIGNNDWVAAGRTIHHLHIQVIPRYKWDIGENVVWGIRRIIPWMGNYRE